MIEVDHTRPIAPFEQIRMQLADQIKSGALAPGTRLPSVRQLAGDLDVAPGTVVRAYSELERNRLITSSRTGTRVAQVEPIDTALRIAADAYLQQLPSYSLEDALQAVRIQWALSRG